MTREDWAAKARYEQSPGYHLRHVRWQDLEEPTRYFWRMAA